MRWCLLFGIVHSLLAFSASLRHLVKNALPLDIFESILASKATMYVDENLNNLGEPGNPTLKSEQAKT